MKTSHKTEAFTGLEAAIVLIAFVVVAAVFSYVVLGAGFFTAQKTQSTVSEAMGRATSNIVISGEVMGQASGTTDDNVGASGVQSILFSVTLAAGGTPVDLNATVFKYKNRTVLQNLDFASNINIPVNPPANYQWAIVSKQNADADTSLEKGERFTIQANLSMLDSRRLPAGEEFTLTLSPNAGAPIDIVKSAPGGITPMNRME